jgi:hypothetical protein
MIRTLGIVPGLVAVTLAMLAVAAIAQVRTADQPQAPTTTVACAACQQVLVHTAEIRDWSRWACILAGLALVTAMWVGWSLRTLAKNQVAIAELIQQASAR